MKRKHRGHRRKRDLKYLSAPVPLWVDWVVDLKLSPTSRGRGCSVWSGAVGRSRERQAVAFGPICTCCLSLDSP